MMLNKNVIVNGGYKSGKTFDIIMPMVDELIKENKSLLFIDKNYICCIRVNTKQGGKNVIHKK